MRGFGLKWPFAVTLHPNKKQEERKLKKKMRKNRKQRVEAEEYIAPSKINDSFSLSQRLR